MEDTERAAAIQKLVGELNTRIEEAVRVGLRVEATIDVLQVIGAANLIPAVHVSVMRRL